MSFLIIQDTFLIWMPQDQLVPSFTGGVANQHAYRQSYVNGERTVFLLFCMQVSLGKFATELTGTVQTRARKRVSSQGALGIRGLGQELSVFYLTVYTYPYPRTLTLMLRQRALKIGCLPVFH